MKSFAGTVTGELIAAVQRTGPCTGWGIAQLMRREMTDVSPRLSYVVNTKRLVVIGTIRQARAAGVEVFTGAGIKANHQRPDTRVYAMPGTAMLPALEGDAVAWGQPVRRPRSSGSGRIAGPRTIGRGLGGWGGWNTRGFA